MKQRLRRILAIVALALVAAGGAGYLALQATRLPPTLNMGTDAMGMGSIDMPANMPHPSATPIAQLAAPPTDAPTKAFTLTAQAAKLDLGGQLVDAWTFNGTAPGPELRVRQGDLVEVTLINKDIAAGVTIHWHGVNVPNVADGVAGVTQDAVKPGESYTYRFITKDVGTYWYHSHQESSLQVPRGLYGALVVEPRQPAIRYDRDYTLVLHEWGVVNDCTGSCPKTLDINGRRDGLKLDARPGERVRLRLVNAGQDSHLPTLLGAPFAVIALDGHDLNAPTPLRGALLPIAAAQRYDLSFEMPASGTVQLVDADPKVDGQLPAVTLGEGPLEGRYDEHAAQFDFAGYGQPRPDPLTPSAHFDVQYDMRLNNHLGLFDGEVTQVFTINDRAFPDIPPIKVNTGDRVKVHITNEGGHAHPIHLHGHTFAVLTRNGKPLTGSPVHLDTLTVAPGESYDIAFVADNPGIWMLHCHILRHAAHAMDMMVEYPNISTPFTIGHESGNHPE